MTNELGSAAVPEEPATRFRASVPRFAGTTSVLYEGRDSATGKPVLVKVVRENALPSTAERQRIRREIQKLVQLRHASLNAVVALGEDGGRLWIARESVEGESLSERLARVGPLPVAEAARIATAVASALGELHRHGVLHRDVRPGHVLLGASGSVHLIDAAVGRTLRAPDGRTTIGTAGFAAPEAVAGKLVSFRSDLYSLGATLFEMLTGAPPFGPPDSPRVLTLQSESDPPQLKVPAPPGLAKLVSSLLAREPRERPFSAQQLEKQLEPFAFAEPVESADDASSTTVGAAPTPPSDSPRVPAPATARVASPALPAAASFAAVGNEAFDDITQVGESLLAPAGARAPAAPRSPAASPPRMPSMPPPRMPSMPPPPRMPAMSPPRAPAMSPPRVPAPGPSRPTASMQIAPVPMRGPSIPPPPPVPRMPSMPPRAATMPPRVPTMAPGSSTRAPTAPPPASAGPRNATLMGMASPLGAPAAAIVQRPAPRAEPASGPPPAHARDASGSIPLPVPDQNDFDDATDTVVQEDSRIFGIPEISNRKANGSAVPPLPDAVAAQVLTGGVQPPGARVPTTNSPGGQPAQRGSAALTPSAGHPMPTAATSPAQAGAPSMENAFTQSPAYSNQFSPDGRQYAPSASEQSPTATMGGSGPVVPPGPAAFQYPPPGASPSQAMMLPSPTPASHAADGYGFPDGSTAPLHPTSSRRALWPWLLAGVGVAALAGSVGYLVANRAHTPSAPTSMPAPPVVAPVVQPVAPPVVAPVVQAVAAPVAQPPGPEVQPAPADPPPSAPVVRTPQPPRSTLVRVGPSRAPTRVVVPTPASGTPRADGALARARQAIERRDYSGARTLLEAAGRQQPSNAEVHYLLGDVFVRTRNLPAAIGELRSAVRLSPRNVSYLHRLADVQSAFGDRNGASATLRQILVINPRDAGARTQLDQMTRGARPGVPTTPTTRPGTATAPPRPGTASVAPRPGTSPAGTTRPVTTPTSAPRPTTTRPGGVPIVNTWGPPAPRPATMAPAPRPPPPRR